MTADDPQHDAIERRLRDAMASQAERFEPSEDSYLRLRREVHAVGDARRPAGRRLGPRLAAAAAAVAVVAGGGAALLDGDGTQPIDVTPASTVPTTTPTPTTTAVEAAPTTTSTAAPEPPAFETVTSEAITGPRSVSADEAVERFTGLVRLDGVSIDLQGAKAELRLGDTWIGTVGIGAVTLYDGSGPGFAVTELHHDDDVLRLDSFVAGATVDAPAVEVSGVAGDDVAGIRAQVFSNHDGLLLDRRTVPVEQDGRFGTALVLSGDDSGWVLVTATDDAGDVIAAVAKPLQWTAGDDDTRYTVAFIDPADPDAGLNVRSLPGTDDDTVVEGVLPAGTADVRRRGQVPVSIDGVEWWAIEGTDASGARLEGWVAASHLVHTGAVDSAAVDELARSLSESAPEAWPWASTAVVGRPTALTVVTDPVTRFGGQLGPLIGWIDGDAAWEAAAPALSGDTAADLAEWWLPGLTPLTFAADDGTRTTLYLEATVEGPRIVGVIGWDG